MIDDDDVFAAAVLTPSGGSGPVGCVVSLACLLFVIALAVIASQNKDECSKRKCEAGSKPMLLKGECLCVAQAKP